MQCFSRTSNQERIHLCSHFNGIENIELQDAYLTKLIDVSPVKQRRGKQTPAEQRKTKICLHHENHAGPIRACRQCVHNYKL